MKFGDYTNKLTFRAPDILNNSTKICNIEGINMFEQVYFQKGFTETSCHEMDECLREYMEIWILIVISVLEVELRLPLNE